MMFKQLAFALLLLSPLRSLSISPAPSKDPLNTVEVIMGTAFGTAVTGLLGYIYSGAAQERAELVKRWDIKNPNSDGEWKENKIVWGAWQERKDQYKNVEKHQRYLGLATLVSAGLTLYFFNSHVTTNIFFYFERKKGNYCRCQKKLRRQLRNAFVVGASVGLAISAKKLSR